MIKGIGTDIIEISRIKQALEKEHFKNRVYTKNEISYAESKSDKYQTYAGMFCAKESIAKAQGKGFTDLDFHKYEILHDELQKPYLLDDNILITISHCKEYATATAIIKG